MQKESSKWLQISKKETITLLSFIGSNIGKPSGFKIKNDGGWQNPDSSKIKKTSLAGPFFHGFQKFILKTKALCTLEEANPHHPQ